MMRFITNVRKIILVGALVFVSISCFKDNYEQVPYVYVHLELGLDNELANLGVGIVATIYPDTVSGWKNRAYIDFNNNRIPKVLINQKVEGNGLILYRSDFSTFYVFDRTCTYRSKEDYCALTVYGREYLPQCPCCKSVFLLESEGLPSSDSKASTPLQQYNAVLYSNRQLVISN